ncbi:MAG TPA: helix-turn-helix transcriptional regulator [Sediminibacterium sp.]|nr:helix-turn-helix transcriptional regulator [Sediminibacterium sp.]
MSDKERILNRFAAHLAQIRRAKGMSIHELAAASGLEYSQVQRIEKGKVNFAFTTLVALAQGLEIEPAELLEGYKPPR